MSCVLLVAASLLAPPAAGPRSPVQNDALRLIVETSEDLKSYRIQAEFSFRITDPSSEILFDFPDARSVRDLEWIELDGRPLDRADVTLRRHTPSGIDMFALACAGCAAGVAAHVLRVRGPEARAPEHGFTRWGRWHPYLGERAVPVRIELEVRTPARYAVFSSGRHVLERIDGTRKVSRWESGIPQGWVFLAIGRYRTLAGTGEAPPFDVVWPEHLTDFRADVVRGEPHAILRHLSSLYGDHGSGPFRLVVFPANALHAFSVNGLIAISTMRYESVRGGGASLRALLAHELAHYWWGDLVQPQGAGSRWMTEGFAEYSKHTYEQAAGGEALPWSFRNLLVVSRFTDGTAPPVLGGEAISGADEIYYQKGAFVLEMLADEIGRDVLHRAMRHVVERGRAASVSLHDFEEAVQQEAGRDLSWFFEQWLRRPLAPLLSLEDVRLERSDAGHIVSGVLRQSAPAYRLRLVADLEAEDGTHSRHDLTVTSELTPFSFVVDRAPAALTMDPEHRVFRWYPPADVPLNFGEAWQALGAAPGQLLLGDDVRSADTARVAGFLRQRFPTLVRASKIEVRHGVVIGMPARELRMQRLPHLDAPPPGTLQAFVIRSVEPGAVLVGIEGDWPEVIPEIVPQAGLDFVRYRGGAIVSATAPSLPPLSYRFQGGR
jgi:hypothetical protein